MNGPPGHMGAGSLAQELNWVKNDCILIRNAVVLLEQEKDNLRQAVRKLKIESHRSKDKIKKLTAEVKRLGGTLNDGEDSEDIDYDDLGKNFILVGAAQDPLSLRFEVTIRDSDGIEHKSAERYYWYKLAEHFNDAEAKKRILEASSTQKAEEAMAAVKNFSEEEWNKVKLRHWERGQQLKLEQVRWIACLLMETDDLYIAVAHQDKVFGTGWRINREEANKPIFWNGSNGGGKYLMKYRKQMKSDWTWAGPNEKEETRKKYLELKKFVWRRIDQAKVGGLGGHMGGGPGGYHGPAYRAKNAPQSARGGGYGRPGGKKESNS